MRVRDAPVRAVQRCAEDTVSLEISPRGSTSFPLQNPFHGSGAALVIRGIQFDGS